MDFSRFCAQPNDDTSSDKRCRSSINVVNRTKESLSKNEKFFDGMAPTDGRATSREKRETSVRGQRVSIVERVDCVRDSDTVTRKQ
jgi:hypothetical protein